MRRFARSWRCAAVAATAYAAAAATLPHAASRCALIAPRRLRTHTGAVDFEEFCRIMVGSSSRGADEKEGEDIASWNTLLYMVAMAAVRLNLHKIIARRGPHRARLEHFKELFAMPLFPEVFNDDHGLPNEADMLFIRHDMSRCVSAMCVCVCVCVCVRVCVCV